MSSVERGALRIAAVPAATSPEPSRAARGRARACALAALGLAAALGASGCGGASATSQTTLRGARLTVYASAPLSGPGAAVARDVVRAERLALARAGGRAGHRRVRLVTLDAAQPETGRWDPARVSQNARRAAADPSAVAYLGELRDGGSAISIPLLNEAGLLEVSPLDTAMALTTRSRAIAGSPERYYPKLREAGRTFARLVPSDRVEAGALAALAARVGVRRIALLNDGDTAALALSDAAAAALRRRGVAVVAREAVDVNARQEPELVARVLARRPSGVLYAGAQPAAAARVFRELARAAPELTLLAPDALADPAFLNGIETLEGTTYVTRPVRALRAYPPAARRFARAFAARWGAAPPPEALYGYEAMRAVLDAVRWAQRRAAGGPLTRAAVVEAFFAGQRRESVLGSYRIAPDGDTTLRRYGVFRVVAGRLRYVRALDG